MTTPGIKKGNSIRLQDGRLAVIMATRKEDPGLGRRPPVNDYGPGSWVQQYGGKIVQIKLIPEPQPIQWDDVVSSQTPYP